MNLTEVSALVKKTFKYLIIFAAAYYILVLGIFPSSAKLIKAILYRRDPPNVLYGKLDPLEFVEKSTNQTSREYQLNTKNGKLPPNLPDRMKVYKFKSPQFSYLAGNNAISDASMLGFTEEDLASDLKGTVYRWRDIMTGSTLSIDKDNRALNLSTYLNSKSMNFTPGSIDQQSAADIAKGILSSIGRFSDPLYSAGTQSVKLGAFVGNKIYETTSLSDAQIAMVDFFRSIDNYSIVGPDPSKGLLRVYVRRQSREPNPMNNPIMDLYYWNVDAQGKATYPIITVKEAWDAVKNGRGVITKVTPKGSNPFDTYSPVSIEKILIDDIHLSYYETPSFQKYLQPIYVFSGKYTTRGTSGGDITIYFPAITGEYTKQVQTDNTQK